MLNFLNYLQVYSLTVMKIVQLTCFGLLVLRVAKGIENSSTYMFWPISIKGC